MIFNEHTEIQSSFQLWAQKIKGSGIGQIVEKHEWSDKKLK